jgi:hypothetical protein
MSKQFPDVSSRYGAPMGRRADGYLETNIARFVRLFRVRLDSGGYDDGGAYWGTGTPLFCAIDDDGNRQFVRAYHRTRAALMLGIPTGALKTGLADWHSYGLAVLDGRAPMPDGMTKDDVTQWLMRCGAAMGQAEDMRPKRLAAEVVGV